jgi:hypothetical protein
MSLFDFFFIPSAPSLFSDPPILNLALDTVATAPFAFARVTEVHTTDNVITSISARVLGFIPTEGTTAAAVGFLESTGLRPNMIWQSSATAFFRVAVHLKACAMDVEAHATAALGGVVLPGLPVAAPTVASVLEAVLAGQTAAANAVATARQGTSDRPTAAQAAAFQSNARLSVLYTDSQYRMLYVSPCTPPEDPITPSNTFVGNAKQPLREAFLDAFASALVANTSVSFDTLLNAVGFRFGPGPDSADLLSFAPRSLDDTSRVTLCERNLTAASRVCDRFLGIATGRPAVFHGLVHDLVDLHIGVAARYDFQAFTINDAYLFISHRLSAVPSAMLTYVPLTAAAASVAAQEMHLRDHLRDILQVDTERVEQYVRARLCKAAFSQSSTRVTTGESSNKRKMNSKTGQLTKRGKPTVPTGAGGRGLGKGGAGAGAGGGGGGRQVTETRSTVDWGTSPIPKEEFSGALPCFYYVASRGRCANAAVGSKCARPGAFPHSFPAALESRRAAFAAWLLGPSKFKFY